MTCDLRGCADSAGVSDSLPTGGCRTHNPLVLGSNPSGPTSQPIEATAVHKIGSIFLGRLRNRRYGHRPCALSFVVRIPRTHSGTTRKEIQFWKNFRGLLYFLLPLQRARGLRFRCFLPSVGGAAASDVPLDSVPLLGTLTAKTAEVPLP
jgi:hypothetical protein